MNNENIDNSADLNINNIYKNYNFLHNFKVNNNHSDYQNINVTQSNIESLNNKYINELSNISTEIDDHVRKIESIKDVINALYLSYFITLDNSLDIFYNITGITPNIDKKRIFDIIKPKNYMYQIHEVRKLFFCEDNNNDNNTNSNFVDLLKDYNCVAVIDRTKIYDMSPRSFLYTENALIENSFIDFVFSNLKYTFSISIPKKLPLSNIIEHYSHGMLHKFNCNDFSYGNILISVDSKFLLDFNVDKKQISESKYYYNDYNSNYNLNRNAYNSFSNIPITHFDNNTKLKIVYYSYNIVNIKNYIKNNIINTNKRN